MLALVVPDSVDRPHLTYPPSNRDYFAAPYRHGPDTDYMVERQLAAAYNEREIGRRQRTEDFDARFEQFLSTIDQGNSVHWVAAIAVPNQPNARRSLSIAKANAVIDHAVRSPICGNFGALELVESLTTKRGLRRFTRTGDRTLSKLATARGHVEVHNDGAIAVAFTRHGYIRGEGGYQPNQVPIVDIESTARDFLALLLATRTGLGVSGDYTARLTVHPTTQLFRRSDYVLSGHFINWDEEHRVHGYRPVDGPIIGTASRDEVISSWVAVVTDAVNQAGVPCSLTADDLITQLMAD